MGVVSGGTKNMEYRNVIVKRRSTYALKPISSVSDDILVARLQEVMKESPSAFNAQSTRLVIALGDSHKKVWEITKSTLKKIIPNDKFAKTEAKLNMFEGGYGTLLLYTDQPTIERLKKDYPLYAKYEDTWADDTMGIMIANIWGTLVDLGLSANMQHYNPLIDEPVGRELKISKDWTLECQIVFGVESSKPGSKDYVPINERVLVKTKVE